MKDITQESKNLSQLWRVGRLLVGKTQVELCRELGISQSSISKYESMALEPSASEWYAFCQFVGIDAHKTLDLGYIDGCSKFKSKLYMTSLFKLPLRYRGDFSLKVRDLIPFKKAIELTLGEREWIRFLENIKVSPELFYVYDFQLSFQFYLDLVEAFKDQYGKLKPFILEQLSLLGNHGVIKDIYLKQKSPAALLKELSDKQLYYQRIFKLEEGKAQSKTAVIEPEIGNSFRENDLAEYIEIKLQGLVQVMKENSNANEIYQTQKKNGNYTISLTEYVG